MRRDWKHKLPTQVDLLPIPYTVTLCTQLELESLKRESSNVRDPYADWLL